MAQLAGNYFDSIVPDVIRSVKNYDGVWTMPLTRWHRSLAVSCCLSQSKQTCGLEGISKLNHRFARPEISASV
jgi:hypothetical protein